MQKAQYTLEWINQNVHYAKGNDYNKIASRSYVDAIFNKKAGQCLQYNGAYAMMLTYLGFEARIIQGWRGTPKNKWSHYWCEMKIDGKWYYFDKVTGGMITGIYQLENKTVYYGTDGTMQYGEQRINNKWYYFDETTGIMQTGFVNLKNKTVWPVIYIFKYQLILAIYSLEVI